MLNSLAAKRRKPASEPSSIQVRWRGEHAASARLCRCSRHHVKRCEDEHIRLGLRFRRNDHRRRARTTSSTHSLSVVELVVHRIVWRGRAMPGRGVRTVSKWWLQPHRAKRLHRLVHRDGRGGHRRACLVLSAHVDHLDGVMMLHDCRGHWLEGWPERQRRH